jgi:sec-independent protein translocase protein TatB
MFDTGFWEFALIAVIVLIVVGPDKMPALAKTAGKYAGKLRNFIANAKSEVADEFDPESLKKQLGLQDENSVASNSILDIVEEVKGTGNDIQNDIKNSMQDSKTSVEKSPKNEQ